jgi:hypothetical protein
MDNTAGTAVHLSLQPYGRQGSPHLNECQEQGEDAELCPRKGSGQQQIAQRVSHAAEPEDDCGSESR